MEMINGEKKLHVWLYKYEQDGVCEIVQRLFSGALNITSTFNLLKQRMGSFNIFSESYPVRENLEGFWNVIVI